MFAGKTLISKIYMIHNSITSKTLTDTRVSELKLEQTLSELDKTQLLTLVYLAKETYLFHPHSLIVFFRITQKSEFIILDYLDLTFLDIHFRVELINLFIHGSNL